MIRRSIARLSDDRLDRRVLRKLEHTYDAVDNITQIVETRASAVTKTFGYDEIDQLISEDWSTGYSADYEYDANGNRTKRTVASTVEDYFYDDGDKLTEIKNGGTVTKSYGYDDSGRRTSMTDSGGTTDYAYDSESRLTSITRSGLTTNSFGYNGFDTRVSKTDSTGTTSYKRAGAGVTSSLLKSTISSTTTDYTPGISSRVSSTSTFMHSGLKNSDEQSGSGGTISASLQYDAFGKQVSSSGTWVGAFKYGGAHGYQTDPDHGLKLLGHRYYEADTGRFLTRDPIKDGRNWYGYCGNGPIGRADPWGLAWIVLSVDQRGIGHAWVMIIWDNEEVWILENTLPDQKELYKSGTQVGMDAITEFSGRADYEYWQHFSENDYDRADIRDIYNGLPSDYNMIDNNCVHFASAIVHAVTKTLLFEALPFELGLDIWIRNVRGKGRRPAYYGEVGMIPIMHRKNRSNQE